jgi:zinc transporter 1
MQMHLPSWLSLALSTQNRLLVVIGMSVVFIVAELTIGFKTHSIAIVADAFHYIGDVLSFVVAFMALKVAIPFLDLSANCIAM